MEKSAVISIRSFSDLDKESKGRINTEAFIEEIILRNSSKKSSHKITSIIL